MPFRNRAEAGERLAKRLKLHFLNRGTDRPSIVIALPRGGVPVASPVAREFGIPLEILGVRKIGAPRHPEFGIGAIVEGGYRFVDSTSALASEASSNEIERVVADEERELSRRVKLYRNDRPFPNVRDAVVLLVDDGLATGVTARAGARYLFERGARRVVLAVPVASARTANELREGLRCEVIALEEPGYFRSVGLFYEDFSQTTDEEVLRILGGAKIRPEAPGLRRSVDAYAIAIKRSARPLREPKDLEPLITELGNRRIVMIGEASHGTHEFYAWRRTITEWLITKYGFDFVAVEGDWPACESLHEYVQGRGPATRAEEALSAFRRWPTWMWGNTEIVRFAEWLRTRNLGRESRKVSFYGLDVYSFFESMDAIVEKLGKVDPFLAKRARDRFGCFEPFDRDERAYAKSLHEFPKGCAEEVAATLKEVLLHRLSFSAVQNARIVSNAERYYRSLIYASEDHWNVRERHMMETLENLLDHHGKDSKAIVWAHNTHVGDYRATDMLRQGHLNIGGLAREVWGGDRVALVGFGTYTGEVTASGAWDGPVEKFVAPPAPPNTVESACHEAAEAMGESAFFLSFREAKMKRGLLAGMRGHRAIGVVYRPEYERFGNFVPTSLAHRYDAFIHIDKTTALEPLSIGYERNEIPETWPSGQ